MSALAIAYPLQVSIPAAHTVVRAALVAARPLFGLGALMTLGLMFKPLIIGLLQATKLAIFPRRSFEERNNRRTMEDALRLDRMARDAEPFQPSLAAELRHLALRE